MTLKRLDFDIVLQKIRNVHGDKFDYSKINYLNKRTKIELLCNKHGSFFTYFEQLLRGQGCPTCAGKNTTIENSLLINFPLIAAEFDTSRNKVKIENISFGSKLKVWWKCKLGHSYDMTIKSRTRKGKEQNCPFCSNRRIDNTNSIKKLKPELLIEWNFEKNSNYTPENLGINSNKKVWWKCKANHEWKSSPNDRIQHNTGCPNCSISGYKSELIGYLYLHIVQINNKTGIKYGITNYPSDRIKQLKFRNSKDRLSLNNTNITNVIIFTCDGSNILSLESEIKNKFGNNYFSKSEFPDGFTETIEYSQEIIISIISFLKSRKLKIYSFNNEIPFIESYL